MKNCHYCAEEIQDAAVKCRFCGEWLEKKEEETNDDMSARFQELTDQHLDEPSEKTSQDCLPDELDEIESSTEFVYSPLAKKPKWGWGWFLLIALIASGFQRVSYYSTPASFLIIAISPFLLLAFYFWYRWKLIAKNQYIIKIWHLSFKAGFITYILALVLVFLASFIGVVQERKDNQVFLTQFQGKVIQLKSEETKINEKFILSPETEEEINTNIFTLEEYLALIGRKKKAYNELVTYMEKYGNRKKDKQIINDVIKLNSNSSALFQVSEDSITSLLNYYKTSDENWYSNYENLMSKMEDVEKKFKISAEKLMEKVKY